MIQSITHPTFGDAICKSLGLDSQRTTSIDIHLRPGGLITATVEYFVDEETRTMLLDLRPKDDGE